VQERPAVNITFATLLLNDHRHIASIASTKEYSLYATPFTRMVLERLFLTYGADAMVESPTSVERSQGVQAFVA